MSSSRCFGVLFSLLAAALIQPCFAQQPAQPPAPTQQQPSAGQPAPQNPAPPASPQPGETGSNLPQQVVRQKKPPEEPYVIEDGGFSIEPIYWLNKAQPTLRGGATATAFGGLTYGGSAKPSIGGEISFPAGRSNSLRISYFRVQGNSNSTLDRDATYFSESYSAGDYIVYNYTLQSAKISWDYLSYTWYPHAGKIRFKTLYEAQFVTVSTGILAPLKPVTTDSSGNTDTNQANGSKNLIYPTLGVGFEQALGRHFRWEAKGSGFGIPHHGNIWDAQASIAIRLSQFEILGGGRAYHFKSSPQGNQYFVDTLSGAYVGLRYYWGRQQ